MDVIVESGRVPLPVPALGPLSPRHPAVAGSSLGPTEFLDPEPDPLLFSENQPQPATTTEGANSSTSTTKVTPVAEEPSTPAVGTAPVSSNDTNATNATAAASSTLVNGTTAIGPPAAPPGGPAGNNTQAAAPQKVRDSIRQKRDKGQKKGSPRLTRGHHPLKQKPQAPPEKMAQGVVASPATQSPAAPTAQKEVSVKEPAKSQEREMGPTDFSV